MKLGKESRSDNPTEASFFLGPVLSRERCYPSLKPWSDSCRELLGVQYSVLGFRHRVADSVGVPRNSTFLLWPLVSWLQVFQQDNDPSLLGHIWVVYQGRVMLASSGLGGLFGKILLGLRAPFGLHTSPIIHIATINITTINITTDIRINHIKISTA